jgi:hypothetical protein
VIGFGKGDQYHPREMHEGLLISQHCLVDMAFCGQRRDLENVRKADFNRRRDEVRCGTIAWSCRGGLNSGSLRLWCHG